MLILPCLTPFTKNSTNDPAIDVGVGGSSSFQNVLLPHVTASRVRGKGRFSANLTLTPTTSSSEKETPNGRLTESTTPSPLQEHIPYPCFVHPDGSLNVGPLRLHADAHGSGIPQPQTCHLEENVLARSHDPFGPSNGFVPQPACSNQIIFLQYYTRGAIH